MAAAKNESGSRARQVVLLGILAVVVALFMAQWIGKGALGGGDSGLGEVSFQAHGVPRLELEDGADGQANEASSQRNPFTYGAPPTPTPNLTPRPTLPPRPTRVVRPRPTPTPRIARGSDGQPKPPPPPFDREFIGHFGPARLKVAAFRKPGDESGTQVIDIAVEGEILDEVFIVREIGLESVVIGFVDYDISEDTRVPLAQN